jgi:hypothetical protein
MWRAGSRRCLRRSALLIQGIRERRLRRGAHRAIQLWYLRTRRALPSGRADWRRVRPCAWVYQPGLRMGARSTRRRAVDCARDRAGGQSRTRGDRHGPCARRRTDDERCTARGWEDYARALGGACVWVVDCVDVPRVGPAREVPLDWVRNIKEGLARAWLIVACASKSDRRDDPAYARRGGSIQGRPRRVGF